MDKLVSAKLTDQDRMSFVNKYNTSSMKPRLFWMANKGDPSIPYDAVPFATANLMEIRCSLGTTSKKKRQEDISSYYCDAKIFIRGIWRFPLAIFRTAGVWCVYVCTCGCVHACVRTCVCVGVKVCVNM